MLRSVIVGAKLCVLACCAACSVALGNTLATYAADTKVDVTVCSGSSSGASLSVSEPQSDSVVSSLPLAIGGTVSSVTQIDVLIDGRYDSTVPIPAGQTTFQTSLQLPEGTHTLTLVGNDVCQFENVTESLVVTYQPKALPSEGGTTPTATPAAPGRPTGTSNGQQGGAPVSADANQLQSIPLVGAVVPIIQDIVRALDIDATAKQGGMIVAMLRFAFFTLGVGLLICGAMVVHFLQRKSLEASEIQTYLHGEILQDPKFSEHTRRNIVIAQSAGLLLICLSFVI